MAGLYRDPPIPYKRAFDSSNPKLVTLTVYNAEDQEDSVKVPLFTDTGGLEELLHTEEAFQNAAEDLDLSVNKYIKYFGRCLCVNAQTKWRALTRSQRDYPTTRNGYTRAVSSFIKEYCSAEDAKDIMHTYLRSSECKKPSNVSCKDHADRMEQLFKYTKRLQGHAPDLSATAAKTILLHSFPSKWINSYGLIHQGIQEDTTVQFIVDHMSCLERQKKRKAANADSDNNNSDSDADSIDSNSSNSDSDSDGEEKQEQEPSSGKRKYNNPCRIPGHDHDWSECPKNRYSKRNKSNSSNNSTATAPSNETGSTASNESFQAHMKRAMESYCAQHDGTLERTIEGTIIFKPKTPRFRRQPITTPAYQPAR